MVEVVEAMNSSRVVTSELQWCGISPPPPPREPPFSRSPARIPFSFSLPLWLRSSRRSIIRIIVKLDQLLPLGSRRCFDIWPHFELILFYPRQGRIWCLCREGLFLRPSGVCEA